MDGWTIKLAPASVFGAYIDQFCSDDSSCQVQHNSFTFHKPTNHHSSPTHTGNSSLCSCSVVIELCCFECFPAPGWIWRSLGNYEPFVSSQFDLCGLLYPLMRRPHRRLITHHTGPYEVWMCVCACVCARLWFIFLCVYSSQQRQSCKQIVWLVFKSARIWLKNRDPSISCCACLSVSLFARLSLPLPAPIFLLIGFLPSFVD